MSFQPRSFAGVGAFCALAGLVAAVPASATIWLVNGGGTMIQTGNPPGETRLEGVPFNGLPFTFAMLIDDSVPVIDGPGPGGVGQARQWPGSVIVFDIQVGPFSISRTPTATNLFFAINDGPSGPTGRVDQVTLSQSTQFGPFRPSLETNAPLPVDGYIHGFIFGRTQVTFPPAPPPSLIESVDLPPLDQVWVPGAPGMLFNLDIRQGIPATLAEANALPRARFVAAGLFFEVSSLPEAGVVPEPASWALMIAGFGLVGMAARRRRHPGAIRDTEAC